MDLEEVDRLRSELGALLAANRDGAVDDTAADPQLLNAIADYIEGADPTGAGLDQLRRALDAAAGEDENSPKQRMKAAGCHRALQLLRDALP
ncbi:hypothetical protein NESM_000139400 [Novymonas esmeraldas]|uniref:Uncharacterized protein n=1 Tax=Novymonas esmeraldas TaxID=1808958 RepID=A0AAW0F678_9TRYP